MPGGEKKLLDCGLLGGGGGVSTHADTMICDGHAFGVCS